MELVPSRRLAFGLRRAAQTIEDNPDGYNWDNHEACNCGHLILAMGLAPEMLLAAEPDESVDEWAVAIVDNMPLGILTGGPYTIWEHVLRGQAVHESLCGAVYTPTLDRAVCSVSGHSVQSIFEALYAEGVTNVEDLEYLSDPAIIARAFPGETRLKPQSPENVVAYMRAWADMIDEVHQEAVRVRPSTPLSRALRRAADVAETPGEYNWGASESCNCGLVARELGAKVSDIEYRGSWTSSVNRFQMLHGRPTPPRVLEFCAATRMELGEVFDLLESNGIDLDEVRHLESLSNPKVRREIKRLYPDFKIRPTEPEAFVLYARTWADMIDGTLVLGTAELELA